MKLHLNSASGINLISGYGADHVLINGRRHSASLLLLPDAIHPGWPTTDYETLREDDFAALAEHHPEILLVAVPGRQPLPKPRLYAHLLAAGIGVEVMELGAACRTYNILVSEERRVLLALILPPAA
jgi:uncharacterized protein